MYRLICIDLDGTLLASNENISVANQECISFLYEKGITLVVATGRHLEETIHLLNEHALLSCFQYIVFADGCGIYDIRNNALLRSQSFSAHDITTIIKIANRKDFAIYNEKNDFHVFHLLTPMMIRNIFANNIMRCSKHRFLPFFCHRYFYRKAEKQKVVLEKLSPNQIAVLEKMGFHIHNMNSSFTEVLPTNKFLAIKYLLRINGTKLTDVLYLGDDFNDLPCFKHFDSIVMGNAYDNLKSYSIIAARTNNDDGVAFALKDIFGN